METEHCGYLNKISCFVLENTQKKIHKKQKRQHSHGKQVSAQFTAGSNTIDNIFIVELVRNLFCSNTNINVLAPFY